MGIILGALGGAGEALQKIGEAHMKAGLEQETYAANAKVGSDLTLAREQALEEFKHTMGVNSANQQREAQVARIGTAAKGIVSGKLADKYATSDAAVAAAQGGASPEVSAAPGNEDVQAALTPEQLGVINQAKARDTSALMGNQDVLTQAAIQTGDISPKDAMANSSKLEINQLKMDNLLARAEDKNANAKEIADVRAEAMKYGYDLRLQAAQEKRLNGHIDTATSRMLITSEDANIRASTTQLNMISRQLENTPAVKAGKPNPDFDNLKAQADELRADIKASKDNKVALFKSLNIMPEGDTPKPTAAPAAPATPASAAKRPPLTQFLKN